MRRCDDKLPGGAAPVTGHAVSRPDVGHAYLPSHVIVPAYGFYGPAFAWGYYGYDPLWYGWDGPYAYRYLVSSGRDHRRVADRGPAEERTGVGGRVTSPAWSTISMAASNTSI